jgi:hypothetical protein
VTLKAMSDCSFDTRFWIRSIRSIFDLYGDKIVGQANLTRKVHRSELRIIHLGFDEYAVVHALYFSKGAWQ